MRTSTLCILFLLPFNNTILAQSTHWDSLYNVINDTLMPKQRYDEAHTLSLQNLKTAETTFGKTHYKYHQSSYQLGQIYYFKKDYKNGIAVLETSCLILEANPYKDSVFYGKALNLIGICFKRLNDNDKAEAYYIKAYQSLIAIKAVFPREFSACLNNLAVLYYELGRTDEAIDFTTQALSYATKNSEPYIARLGTLSLLYKRKGRFKEAFFMAQEALKLTDKKNPQYDQRIGTLSSLYADIGLLDKAYELTKEAYDIVGQNKGKNAAEYANWSKNLSILNTQLGRHNQALIYALQAQSIEENRKDRPEYYFYQAQVANCYIHLGQTEKALPLLTEALDKLAIKPGKKSEAYLNAMGNLIRLHQKQGDIAKAVALNKEELDLVKAAWSDTDDRYFVAQMRLIELYNANAQYTESTKELKILVQKLNNQVLYNIDVLDEWGKEQFIANFAKDFEPLLFSHIKNNAPQDTALLTLAFETELAMKGIILSSSQLFKQIASRQQNALYKSWEKQKDGLSKAYMHHAGQRPIDSLNAELGKIEEKLIASTPELQHIQRKTARFKDIQQNLKSDACAIEFVRFRHHNNQRWTDTFYYAALIVKPNQPTPDCVFLCEENELKTLISKNKNAQQLYATRGKSKDKTRGNTEGVAVLPSKTLYNLVWKPLQNHLTNVKMVYYATAGILHQVAFAALPIDETNVLSDQYHLNALSSTRTILQKPEAVKIDNVTLYGGILYDAQGSISTHPNAWEYLSGTKKEVGKIATLLSELVA